MSLISKSFRQQLEGQILLIGMLLSWNFVGAIFVGLGTSTLFSLLVPFTIVYICAIIVLLFLLVLLRRSLGALAASFVFFIPLNYFWTDYAIITSGIEVEDFINGLALADQYLVFALGTLCMSYLIFTILKFPSIPSEFRLSRVVILFLVIMSVVGMTLAGQATIDIESSGLYLSASLIVIAGCSFLVSLVFYYLRESKIE